MVRRATPRIERLFARVRRCTTQRGMKAQLARFLGVPPQRLTDWFSGAIVPGGEVVLQLLEWVAAEEAKQQTKRAGGASTRPALKTRKAKSTSHEKDKSGP